MSSDLLLNPRFFGARVLRVEDKRLLTGHGRYVDDLPALGALHAAFLRSPYAHARIEAIDVSGALKAGAVAAFAAEDLGPAWKEFPIPVPHPALRPHNTVPLAKEKTRYVGEPVAVVLAEHRGQAEDALEEIRVSYEILEATSHPVDALQKDAPLVHEDLGDNVAAHLEVQIGDAEKAMARAPRRETLRLKMQRGGSGAMETRGLLASYDPKFDRLTLYASTQTPHLMRKDLAYVLDRPESTIDVIAPDVGGGFGPKVYSYPEDVVISWSAIQLGRPVKWIEDRLEHIQSSVQEREQFHEVEVGFDEEGRILALKDRGVCDIGAYLPWSIVVPLLSVTCIPGPYKVRHFKGALDVVYTHRVPVAPVRGAGRIQSIFIIERMIDRIADVLDLDSAEVRRRNFVQPDEFPYELGLRARDGSVMTYDSGDYPGLMELALKAAGYEDFRKGKRRPGEEGDPEGGRYVGMGISFNVEGTGFGPYEGVILRVEPSGRILLATGAASQGQGHETMLAQAVADALTVKPEDITVVTGNTRAIPYGMGAFASRTAVMATNSAVLAGKTLKKKILEAAASRLEASVEDLDLADGNVFVRGVPDRSVTFGELARDAAGVAGVMMGGKTPGLEASEYYTPSMPATSSSCQVCVVEVDVQTGFVKVLRHILAHDCGRVINPLLLEGQVHGGVVHGIGEALIEEVVFDENGTPLASTFLDYLLPLATDVPDFELLHQETPSPFNPLGIKGGGECGTMGAPAVVASAVEDALRPLGIQICELPLTPYRLWRILQGGNSPVEFRL
ncbi:MAG: molybdopterin cofactor-binding domain-containing protein [Nitrospinota bacterium]